MAYLSDDGVVRGGNVVSSPTDDLEGLLKTGGDPVEGFLVRLEHTAGFAARSATLFAAHEAKP
jgi:hypothetical protein